MRNYFPLSSSSRVQLVIMVVFAVVSVCFSTMSPLIGGSGSVFQIASANDDDDGLVVVGAIVVHLSAVQAPGSSRGAGLVGRQLGVSLVETYSHSLFSNKSHNDAPLYFNNRQIQTLSAQSPMALRAASGILEGIYETLPSPTTDSALDTSSSSSSSPLSAPLPYFPPPMRSHNDSILPVVLGNVLLEQNTLLLPNGGAPGRRAWLESVVVEGGVSPSSVLPSFEASFMNPYVLTGKFDTSDCGGLVCCKAIVRQASALMDSSRMVSSSSSSSTCPTCLNTTVLAEMAKEVNVSIPYTAVTSTSWGCVLTSDGSMVRSHAVSGCVIALYADLQARQTSNQYVPPTILSFTSAFRNTQFVMNQLIYSVLPLVLQNVAEDAALECALVPTSSTTQPAPVGFELGLAVAQLANSFNPSSSPKMNVFTLEADASMLLGTAARESWPAGWPRFTQSSTSSSSTPLGGYVSDNLLASSEAALVTLLLSTGINITSPGNTNSPFALAPGTTLLFEIVNDTSAIIIDGDSSLFVRTRVGTPATTTGHNNSFTFVNVDLPCEKESLTTSSSGNNNRCSPSAWISYLYSTLPNAQPVPPTPADAALALRRRVCLLSPPVQKLLNCSNTDTISSTTTPCARYRRNCPDLACCQLSSGDSSKCAFGLNAQALNCGALVNSESSLLRTNTATTPLPSSRRLRRLQLSLTSNSSVEDLIDSMTERARIADLDKRSWRYVLVSVVGANAVVGLPLISMILMWCWGWHLTTNVAHLDPQEEEEERQKLLSSFDVSRPKQSPTTGDDNSNIIGSGGYSLYSPVDREAVNGSPDSDQSSSTSGGKRRAAPTLQLEDPQSTPHAYGRSDRSHFEERDQLLLGPHGEDDSMIMRTPERLTTPPPSPGNVVIPPTSAEK